MFNWLMEFLKTYTVSIYCMHLKTKDKDLV